MHLVDLDGARDGRLVNQEAVRTIVAGVQIDCQLGGGIRDRETVDLWLGRGIKRVILGTAAVRQPDLVNQACGGHPGRVAIGIDARDGKVAVEGWTETSEITALDLAHRFEDCGVAAIIYTDINRDGAMAGVNVDATVDLAFALTTPVIASGGVTSIADIRELKENEAAGIEGTICGRALYDGRLDPEAALALARA